IGTVTSSFALTVFGSGGSIALDANSSTPNLRFERGGDNNIIADQGGSNLAFFTGGSNSSNRRLYITNAGLFGINNVTPQAILDIRGTGTTTLSQTIPVASFSAQTSFAAEVVDNSGVGDLFTAST